MSQVAACPQQVYYKDIVSSKRVFRLSYGAETFCLNKGQLRLNIFKQQLPKNTESGTLGSLAHSGGKRWLRQSYKTRQSKCEIKVIRRYLQDRH